MCFIIYAFVYNSSIHSGLSTIVLCVFYLLYCGLIMCILL